MQPEQIAELIVAALQPLHARVKALETREALPGRDGRDGIPGPSGRDGINGQDGAHGHDGAPGADGLGFEDLEVLHDGERSFTLRYSRGDRIKDVGTFRIPSEIYRGVWGTYNGGQYERGDCVTWKGSEWHCNTATTGKPGESGQAWTLKVRAGQPGKDGKP